MMIPSHRPALLALAAVLATVAWLAFASPTLAHGDRGRSGDHDDALRAVEMRQALPLARIMSIAREAVPGEIIEIELDHDDDQLIYEVKILARNGRVREVEIDARTGAVLKVEDED